MLRLVPFALALAAPAFAQEAPRYDVAERTRAFAFDPARFFAERPDPAIAIRYVGDDRSVPVYAIAVRRGCIDSDRGEARLECGQRLIARMVRAPFPGTPRRPRERGYRLIRTLEQSRPDNDDALRRGLDGAGLEWMEADVRQCPKAMAQLATMGELRFATGIDFDRRLPEIVLHADIIRFEVGDYLLRASYEGWLKPSTAGAWANAFADSLEGCWKPATAPVPWKAPVQ